MDEIRSAFDALSFGHLQPLFDLLDPNVAWYGRPRGFLRRPVGECHGRAEVQARLEGQSAKILAAAPQAVGFAVVRDGTRGRVLARLGWRSAPLAGAITQTYWVLTVKDGLIRTIHAYDRHPARRKSGAPRLSAD